MEGLSRDIQRICASSDKLQSDDIEIYQPKLKKVDNRQNSETEKYEFGRSDPSIPEKVIMMVGSTGSGKTTLINGIINFIFGVEYDSPVRFKLITEPNSDNQAQSQTRKITAYTIHHEPWFNVPYTLTIIDTPGFGDTTGIERDMEITAQIHDFFSTQGVGGIDHVDAVAFVMQSSLCRLTPTQRYVFDQILSLFGRDIEENIFLMLTFSDGQKPQVLSATKEANIPSDVFFKFNNSAVFATSDDEDESDILRLSWNMGKKNFEKFLQELDEVQAKSLTLTKEVLDERIGLRNKLSEIQANIQATLITLGKLKKEKSVLQQHQTEMDTYKDYEYEIEVPEVKLVPTAPRKRSRRLRRSLGLYPSQRYVTTIRKEKRTQQDIKQRYEEAAKKKLSCEDIIAMIQKDLRAHELKVLNMTEEMRKSLDRLAEIALKPNPLSTVKYIDTLIAAEEAQANPGFDARVKQLLKLRKEADEMQMLADKDSDPLKEYIGKMEEDNNVN